MNHHDTSTKAQNPYRFTSNVRHLQQWTGPGPSARWSPPLSRLRGRSGSAAATAAAAAAAVAGGCGAAVASARSAAGGAPPTYAGAGGGTAAAAQSRRGRCP
jgi:hypothetical protein